MWIKPQRETRRQRLFNAEFWRTCRCCERTHANYLRAEHWAQGGLWAQPPPRLQGHPRGELQCRRGELVRKAAGAAGLELSLGITLGPLEINPLLHYAFCSFWCRQIAPSRDAASRDAVLGHGGKAVGYELESINMS